MKLRRKNLIIVALLVFCMLLSGCTVAGRKVVFTTGLGAKDVFRIGERTCTLPEAKVYLCNYQNIYGTAYGLDLFGEENSSTELEKYVRDLTINELARINCMDMLAEEKGISLTEEEENKAKEAAKSYYDSLSDAEIKYMDVTEENIQKLYQDYALADKLYHALTEGVNEEVSDDEARIMHAMQIFVTTKEAADAVAGRMANGDDFSALASEYNEAGEIEVTIGRGMMPQAVEDTIFSMEDGEVTGCIETEKGYYFLKCVNKYDEELTQENKVKIAEQREKTAFDDAYNDFVAKQDSMMNQELWEKTELNTSGEIKTNSFFAVYEQYFK